MPIVDRFALAASTAVLCMLAYSPVRAEGPTTEVMTGGLVFATQQALLTRKEDVVISASRVRATYVVQNPSPEPRSLLMAFALPDIDTMALEGSVVDNPAYDPLNPSNFVGFAALVDGQPVDTYVEGRALALGLVDVTTILRDFAIPIYPLLSDMQVRLAALPDATKADLIGRSVVRSADGQVEPQWTLRTTMFWQQAFAAGQERTIAIAYRPISGTSTWTAETAPGLQQRYCVPAAAATELAKRTAPVSVRWVHFAAGAGGTARGPVASYRIAVEPTPRQEAYSCREGLAASTAAGSREVLRKDFIPEDEVDVLFID